MIEMRNIAAPERDAARPSKWMKSLITFCLLITLVGGAVFFSCQDMGMEIADSCCSKAIDEDHSCPPELCIAKAPYVATGSEPSVDLAATLLPSPIGGILIGARPSVPVSYKPLRSVHRGDAQALLQVFLI